MIALFFASLIAGIILAAPVGVVGALVAEAALAHRKNKVIILILISALGDGIKAYLLGSWADYIHHFFNEYEGFFFLTVGVAIIFLSIMMMSKVSREKSPYDGEVKNRAAHLLKRHASILALLVIIMLHPGSLAGFLFVTLSFSIKFPYFSKHILFFAVGITLGSLIAFGFLGRLFWKLRKKAERFIFHFRQILAIIIFLIGMYLIIDSCIIDSFVWIN